MNRFEKSLDRIKKRIEIGEKWTDEDVEHYKTIIEALKMAAEVKHGEWVWTEEGEEDYEQFWKCSKCGERAYYMMRFCPNCGAKMNVKDGG